MPGNSLFICADPAMQCCNLALQVTRNFFPVCRREAGTARRTNGSLQIFKRSPLLDESKQGSMPDVTLSDEEHARNNLPDLLNRWRNRAAEANRARTDQSFLVPKEEIAGHDYDLSINRYKEVVYEAVEYDPPNLILERLMAIEEEIKSDLGRLQELLS